MDVEEVQKRIDRALSQRIQFEPSNDGCIYNVIGTRGIGYKVTLCESDYSKSKCSCPDFIQRKRKFFCKHICYVFLRSKHWSTEDIISLFSLGIQPSTHNVEKETTEEDIDVTTLDDCPICYDSFKPKERPYMCVHCDKSFHDPCVRVWKTYCAKKRNLMTCPMCRGKWS